MDPAEALEEREVLAPSHSEFHDDPVDTEDLAVDFMKVKKPGRFGLINEQGQVRENFEIGDRGHLEKIKEVVPPGDLVTAVIVLGNAKELVWITVGRHTAPQFRSAGTWGRKRMASARQSPVLSACARSRTSWRMDPSVCL